MFDNEMEMREQVAQITRSCYAQLRNISQIRRYLTTEATERLINAFVTSRLDNHNSMLFGVSDYLVDKLQLIQNQAARVITQQRKFDHITQTLKALHWLPVKHRIEYKILLFAYKCQHKKAPIYLADLLFPHLPSRSLRSEKQLRLDQPGTKNKYGDRAFSVGAPRLWNSLPMYVKEAETLDTFKSRLKTYLFRKAYGL
jgi:flagellar biosynthesis chaperone FliJ